MAIHSRAVACPPPVQRHWCWQLVRSLTSSSSKLATWSGSWHPAAVAPAGSAVMSCPCGDDAPWISWDHRRALGSVGIETYRYRSPGTRHLGFSDRPRTRSPRRWVPCPQDGSRSQRCASSAQEGRSPLLSHAPGPGVAVAADRLGKPVGLVGRPSRDDTCRIRIDLDRRTRRGKIPRHDDGRSGRTAPAGRCVWAWLHGRLHALVRVRLWRSSFRGFGTQSPTTKVNLPSA
ncbi:hypothetical protein M2280_000948 [Prescottella agglutinans]|uniref:Uncharacterized protein n=1 Tax=Prescottella agglutinans TaxID=1644129 RepID=A0ABT6M605_9NOCA|nr:hypothetical protein [Prescottella agglutinans]